MRLLCRLLVCPQVSSLLSFATSAQSNASTGQSGNRQGHLSGELTLFDIDHYGIAIMAVDSGSGTWKAAFAGSDHLDIELRSGKISWHF